MSEASVIDAVAACLESFLARMRGDAAEHGPDAESFVELAAGTLAGGKRLRARFCHAGWSATARFAAPRVEAPEALWGLGAALEIFQSAALVHDDLIDNSDTRRGRPAAHRALEAAHRASRWSGDASAFGRAAAVLIGDLLVAWSDDLLEQSLVDHPAASAVRAEYARMRRDVTIGQLLDIAEESAWSVSPPEELVGRALRVASLKSARYSVEQPLVLGASLAGADEEQIASLRAFGRPLGLAFQLRDDVLGVFGDEHLTGKPAGDDIREGKRTALIAITRERSDAAAQTLLDARLGVRDLDAAQVSDVQRRIRATGALETVEELIAENVERSERALVGARLDPESVAALRELGRAATDRVA